MVRFAASCLLGLVALNPVHCTNAGADESEVVEPAIETSPDLVDRVVAAMQQSATLPEVSNVEELAAAVQQATGLPVLIDDEGLRRTGAAIDSTVDLPDANYPLKTHLHVALQPLALRARPTEFGLQITTDFAVLCRRGIQTDHWINVDGEMIEAFETACDKVVSFQFFDQPLHEIAIAIGESAGMEIKIDHRALENIGLTEQVPVLFESQEIRLGDMLTSILRNLDLTLTVIDGRWHITTFEQADDEPLLRIYWLDGLVPEDPRLVDFTAYKNLIETTIDPTTWPATSTSTILDIYPGRPGLIVANSYQRHVKIAELLARLREGYLEPQWQQRSVQYP